MPSTRSYEIAYQHVRAARPLRRFGGHHAVAGEAALRALAGQLERVNPDAAASLREGLAETLTVTRLGVTGSLLKAVMSTNPAEPPDRMIHQEAATKFHGQRSHPRRCWCACVQGLAVAQLWRWSCPDEGVRWLAACPGRPRGQCVGRLSQVARSALTRRAAGRMPCPRGAELGPADRATMACRGESSRLTEPRSSRSPHRVAAGPG
jgi:hypothetical protein